METISLDKTMTTAATPFNRFEHCLVGFLYLVFCIMGVSLNLMTAVIFYKDTKLVRKPWIHMYLAMANVGVVAPSPFPASSSFSGKWLYGPAMCNFYAFEGMFFGIMAIGFVVAMCIERYVVDERHKITEKNMFFYWGIVALNIGNSFFWATMPLVGWTRYDLDPAGTSCALDWKDPDDGFTSYLLTLEILSFFIPLCVAIACLYYKHTILAEPKPGPSVEMDMSQQPAQDQDLPGLSEDQLLKLCYIFLIFVLVGWGPFAFLCTIAMVMGKAAGLSMLASSIPPLACKLMVSAYPLAYAIMSPRFRRSCHHLFHSSEHKTE